MLAALGRWLRGKIAGVYPWTNAYGCARTLLALGTLSTLVFSDTATLFRPSPGIPAFVCEGAIRMSAFCLVAPRHVGVVRWVAIMLLVIVASGWRPRLTGVVHWWISFSFMAVVRIADGGDQLTAILTMLLIPVTLTDPRRWHWDALKPPRETPETTVRQMLALSSLMVVRIQVSIVYFESAVAKLRVPEWADGTAIYYWFTDPRFGAAPWLRPITTPLLHNPTTVVLLTWGPILLEVLLFTGLVMDRRYRKSLLVAGITFHGGIAIVQGLGSFALAMWGALVLFLYPLNEQIGFLRQLAAGQGLRWKRLRPRNEVALAGD